MNFDFLTKLNPNEQIIFLISFISVLILILAFLVWAVPKIISLLSNGKIDWNIVIKSKHSDKDKFDTSSTFPEPPIQPSLAHPQINYIIGLLQAQQLMLTQVFHIKDHDILAEQMSYAENKVDMVTSVDEVNFSLLLQKIGKTDYLYSEEYIAYRALAEFKKEKILTKFRHMCKENHFAEKSEEDFNEYARNNTTIVGDMLIDYSKRFFPFYLSLPGYAKFVETTNTKMNTYIIDILYNARDVSIRANAKVNNLFCEFETEYEKTIGVRPKRICI